MPMLRAPPSHATHNVCNRQTAVAAVASNADDRLYGQLRRGQSIGADRSGRFWLTCIL